MVFSKKNKNQLIHILWAIYLLLLASSPSTQAILEIPIRAINVTGIPKIPFYSNKSSSIDNQQEISPNSSSQEEKYIYDPTIKSMIHQSSATINGNLLFIGDIKLGSQEQTFSLVLDTGSFVIWVAKKGSTDTGTINHHFDPSTSNTAQKTSEVLDLTYGTGSCSGYYYYDNIKFLNQKIWMKFGVASKTDFEAANADGIIGLSREEMGSYTSLISMLSSKQIIDSEAFSFKFDSEIKDGTVGKMYLGEHEDFSSSKTTTCSLLDNTLYEVSLWSCRMNSFTLKNGLEEVKASGRFSILFDTGTNGIFLPMEYLQQMKDTVYLVGCEIVKSQEYYRFRCNKYNLPKFEFEIDGNTYIIPSEFLFYSEGSYALSTIYFGNSMGGQDVYIMGSPFFITFHTLFDKERERLVFYPLDPSNLIKGGSAFLTFLYILIVIALFAALVYILYRFYIWKKNRDALIYNVPSNNYYASSY